MGTNYETIVLCIGSLLLIGAMVMLMLSCFAEAEALSDWEIPKPNAPEIYDAEYSIAEEKPSQRAKAAIRPKRFS